MCGRPGWSSKPLSDGETASADGRTARRDRNRDAVLDAVLDLFGEGHLFPSTPQVAERSGVSLRSVFRYYEDTEALIRAAMGRHLERIAPLFDLADPGEGPFEDRVRRFVASRLRLYGAVAPTARAGTLRAATNRTIADQLDVARERAREQLEAMFAPELRALPAAERRIAVAAADTMFQFAAVEHLHEHLGLSRSQVGEILRRSLRSVLAAGAR